MSLNLRLIVTKSKITDFDFKSFYLFCILLPGVGEFHMKAIKIVLIYLIFLLCIIDISENNKWKVSHTSVQEIIYIYRFK